MSNNFLELAERLTVRIMSNVVPDLISLMVVKYSYYYFFFDMSAQEGGGRFELVTSVSLGVVPAD